MAIILWWLSVAGTAQPLWRSCWSFWDHSRLTRITSSLFCHWVNGPCWISCNWFPARPATVVGKLSSSQSFLETLITVHKPRGAIFACIYFLNRKCPFRPVYLPSCMFAQHCTSEIAQEDAWVGHGLATRSRLLARDLQHMRPRTRADITYAFIFINRAE